MARILAYVTGRRTKSCWRGNEISGRRNAGPEAPARASIEALGRERAPLGEIGHGLGRIRSVRGRVAHRDPTACRASHLFRVAPAYRERADRRSHLDELQAKQPSQHGALRAPQEPQAWRPVPSKI